MFLKGIIGVAFAKHIYMFIQKFNQHQTESKKKPYGYFEKPIGKPLCKMGAGNGRQVQ